MRYPSAASGCTLLLTPARGRRTQQKIQVRLDYNQYFSLAVCLDGYSHSSTLQVWSNYSTLAAELGDCYLVVFCRSGAISRPWQWSWVIVICLHFAGLEQLFDLGSGVG
jgi:hypothetical protein